MEVQNDYFAQDDIFKPNSIRIWSWISGVISRYVTAYPLSLVFFGDFSAGKVSRSQLRMVGASGGFSPISAARSCVVSAAQSRAAVTHGMSKDSDEERMSFTTRWLGSDEDR